MRHEETTILSPECVNDEKRVTATPGSDESDPELALSPRRRRTFDLSDNESNSGSDPDTSPQIEKIRGIEAHSLNLDIPQDRISDSEDRGALDETDQSGEELT
jgi:hypothetical protein